MDIQAEATTTRRWTLRIERGAGDDWPLVETRHWSVKSMWPDSIFWSYASDSYDSQPHCAIKGRVVLISGRPGKRIHIMTSHPAWAASIVRAAREQLGYTPEETGVPW